MWRCSSYVLLASNLALPLSERRCRIKLAERELTNLFRAAFKVTEQAISVFCLHMLGQLSLSDKASWLSTVSGTFIAPESKRTMNAILVLAQGASGVVPGVAVFAIGWVNVLTWIWRKLEMVAADVTLKCLR